MNSKIAFSGNILVIGCGSVSQCTLPLLLDLIDVPPERITVLDFVDNSERIAPALAKGVRYIQDRITPETYAETLSRHVAAGDIIVDLAWNIDTMTMLDWCRSHGVLYLNTSVEKWDPFEDSVRTDPRNYTLYVRQMELRDMLERWGDNAGPSAIVDHGANPGLVSHFTKEALTAISRRIAGERPSDSRTAALETALEKKDFRKMAQLSGVKVIHISERDSQITSIPKEVNEFVNTWSVEGLLEEGLAPAELGWGTHERTLPANAYTYDGGPRNQICLSSLGIETWARSWVPSGEILGMIIRHGEAFGISDRLTVWEGNRAVYRPTVHYVYCPSDSTIVSLHELKMRQYQPQPAQRILNDEITSGRDELGVLLMGHDFGAWWAGSLLDIEEARRLVPGQNATTLQVAISVVAGVVWMIENPSSGLRLPDDVDHERILEISMPYLGPYVSQAVDWDPLKNADRKFTRYNSELPAEEDRWQFASFVGSR